MPSLHTCAPPVTMPQIRCAHSEADLDAARALFREYVDHLDFDLNFQDFEREMDALPGPYASPNGAILLAEVEETPVGVVAVKPLEEGICEMKRLYVTPAYRGQGLGRALAEAIIETAGDLGYKVMRLDTVASMTPARTLYRSLDFEERSPYYHNPLDEAVYMERTL